MTDSPLVDGHEVPAEVVRSTLRDRIAVLVMAVPVLLYSGAIVSKAVTTMHMGIFPGVGIVAVMYGWREWAKTIWFRSLERYERERYIASVSSQNAENSVAAFPTQSNDDQPPEGRQDEDP
ncbi:MAG: hypothetical protein ACREPQ_14405 [Rhodanobacter sp.]